MPTPSVTLWIDSNNNRLLSGWQSLSPAVNLQFKHGDSVGIEFHWVAAGDTGVMSEIQFPDAATMTLAIGQVDAAPTGGGFTLTYGGQTTSEIDYNFTPESISTALNALSTITADGGVTVTKNGNIVRILWSHSVTAGEITVGSNDLYPTSIISNKKLREGSGSVKQISQIHIKQAPIANLTSFTNQEPSSVIVTQTHVPQFDGDIKTWRVKVAPKPKGGSFFLSWNNGLTSYRTRPISVNSSEAGVLSLLSSPNGANESWFVNQVDTSAWDVSTTTSSVFNLVGLGSGIDSFRAKYGILNLNTSEIEYLLAGQQSVSTMMELQLSIDGTTTTLFQAPVTIYNDLIGTDVYSIVSFGQVMPVDSVVRFDTSQSLSTAEKSTARANIGAISSSDISGITTTKDVELEGRLTIVEGNAMTTNQKAALNAATTLSGTDKVVANSVLTTALATKANTVHSHQIADVVGLQTILDSKIDSTYQFAISNVTGLQGQLDEKSNVTHTHSSFDTLFINTINIGQTLNLPAASANTNYAVGNLTVGIYPKEIFIYVNNVLYAIPARIV